MNEAPDELVVCNGIDGLTGRYAVAPASIASLAERARRLARAPVTPPDALRSHFTLAGLRRLGDLRRMGWAVVFPSGTPDMVRTALAPLLARRREQAGDRFKILEYDPHADTFRSWLRRHDVGPGDPNRDRVPLYLLLVGSPDVIPFEVQYLLDIEYAVGRIAFDTPAEYAAYAQSVVEYERAQMAIAGKEIVYWSPAHEYDVATNLSSEQLIQPLVHGDPAAPKFRPPAGAAGFRSTLFEREAAEKQRLIDVFHRPAHELPPAMIFTASHGVAWPRDHEKQMAAQGALLAQDWDLFDEVGPEHYVSASDIGNGARVHGLVAFLFACFGAGTPEWDSFNEDRRNPAERIASRSFVAALPRRLLAHPNGGALAVIGHVDRAWGFSIVQPGGRRRIGPFRMAVETILSGHPVGLATNDLSVRHAVLGAWLTQMLGGHDVPTDHELASAWIEHNDAQSYVLLGDPAARLSAAALG
ncbi:MAG: hypothetical protein QM820_32480 [Minicystis sp.]